MGVCILHDLGELLVHSLHQGQDATTNTERLLNNTKNALTVHVNTPGDLTEVLPCDFEQIRE